MFLEKFYNIYNKKYLVYYFNNYIIMKMNKLILRTTIVSLMLNTTLVFSYSNMKEKTEEETKEEELLEDIVKMSMNNSLQYPMDERVIYFFLILSNKIQEYDQQLEEEKLPKNNSTEEKNKTFTLENIYKKIWDILF